MRYSRAIRRILALSVLLILAVWVVSLFYSVRYTGRGWSGRIGEGTVSYVSYDLWWNAVQGWHFSQPSGTSDFGFVLPQVDFRVHMDWNKYVRIPLWCPLLLCGFGIVCWRQLMTRKGAPPRCEQCGYDIRSCTRRRCSECGYPIRMALWKSLKHRKDSGIDPAPNH